MLKRFQKRYRERVGYRVLCWGVLCSVTASLILAFPVALFFSFFRHGEITVERTGGCFIGILLVLLLFTGVEFLLLRRYLFCRLEVLAGCGSTGEIEREKLASVQPGKRQVPFDEITQIAGLLDSCRMRADYLFAALQKSETRLRLFFDAAEESVFGVGSDGCFTFMNGACLQSLGRASLTSIIGRPLKDLLQFEDSEKDSGNFFSFDKALQQGVPCSSEEGLLSVEDGLPLYISIRAYPVIEKGTRRGAIFFFTDISAQREVIREKNLLHHAIFNSPFIVVFLDTSGRILSVNPGFEQQTGYAADEVVGGFPTFVSDVQSAALTVDDFRRRLQENEKWQNIYLVTGKDGQERYVELTVAPVYNREGEITEAVAIGQDVTEKLELQNQLTHIQKMEAVGRLAASFAHEFGNPLLGVHSVIKDIVDRVQGAEDRELLQVASSECERMRGMLKDFRQFQLQSDTGRDLCDIREVVEHVLLFTRKNLAKNDIVLLTEYDDVLPQVFVSQEQMSQVFLNLVLNAVDAMENGGTLTVSVASVEDHVSVAFKDTGCGIPEEARRLIFEPFFTTKPEVQGTGLGLSVSYSIVAAHGGDVGVVSEPGKGTAFTVTLPAMDTENEE